MTSLSVLWRQLRSPLVLLLVFAAGASAATGAWTDALIVTAIVLATVGIGWRREYRAETAIALLLARVQITARVRRGDGWANVPVSAVVAGDVVQLSAGSIVPGVLPRFSIRAQVPAQHALGREALGGARQVHGEDRLQELG